MHTVCHAFVGTTSRALHFLSHTNSLSHSLTLLSFFSPILASFLQLTLHPSHLLPLVLPYPCPLQLSLQPCPSLSLSPTTSRDFSFQRTFFFSPSQDLQRETEPLWERGQPGTRLTLGYETKYLIARVSVLRGVRGRGREGGRGEGRKEVEDGSLEVGR